MEIRHLCFAYGNNPVIKDLSFTIEEGKITTILGPNGCGKTSTQSRVMRTSKTGTFTVWSARTLQGVWRSSSRTIRLRMTLP